MKINKILRVYGLFCLIAPLALVALLVGACNNNPAGPSAGVLTTLTLTPSPISLAVDSTRKFTVVGKDANGNVVTVVPIWSVVGNGGAIDSTGLFKASRVAGTYTDAVKVTSGSVSTTASVTVNPGPLEILTLTPGTATLASGGIQQFSATGKDAYGNVITMVPTWSVQSGGGTINSSTGMYTAGTTTGTYTVSAMRDTVSSSATVTVQ